MQQAGGMRNKKLTSNDPDSTRLMLGENKRSYTHQGLRRVRERFHLSTETHTISPKSTSCIYSCFFFLVKFVLFVPLSRAPVHTDTDGLNMKPSKEEMGKEKIPRRLKKSNWHFGKSRFDFTQVGEEKREKPSDSHRYVCPSDPYWRPGRPIFCLPYQ